MHEGDNPTSKPYQDYIYMRVTTLHLNPARIMHTWGWQPCISALPGVYIHKGDNPTSKSRQNYIYEGNNTTSKARQDYIYMRVTTLHLTPARIMHTRGWQPCISALPGVYIHKGDNPTSKPRQNNIYMRVTTLHLKPARIMHTWGWQPYI